MKKVIVIIAVIGCVICIRINAGAQASTPFVISLPKESLAKKMAATAMSIWKDSFSLEESRPARWSYDQGVILKGMESIWMNTGDPLYFKYIQKSMDFYVENNGSSIKGYKSEDYNIDNINNGKILLLLFRVTGQQKYLNAAKLLRAQLQTHPRTNEGSFWHKKVYPYQVWLDGLYMGQPFYAEYAMLAHEDNAFDDIADQFIRVEKHTRDAKTGLLYHAWDESKQQKWANKETGTSPHFWGRAMGWYGMALVDVLDYFPKDHPKRKALIDILNRMVNAVEKVQDKKTGLWYDILDLPTRKGNYLESSASSMIVYAIAKGVRLGYVPVAKLSIAQKGYSGLAKEFIKTENGQTNLHGTVKVSGLGGSPYRDGSFDYYMSEPVIVNDPKGVGAFLQAASEMEMSAAFSFARGKTVALDNYFNHESRTDAFGKPVEWHYKWNELENGGFSFFGRAFTNNGASLTTLGEPTAQNLSKANVYIIVDPDIVKENPSPDYVEAKHVDAIANWVKNGGVLLLMGNDSGNAEFTHFNQLAERFGIHFNENSINHVSGSQWETGSVFIPATNTIFKKIDKVYLKELSTLRVKAPAKTEVENNGNVIIAVAKYGKGTVFAVGDPWIYNEYMDGRRLPMEYKNFEAGNALAHWLLQQSVKK